MSTTHLDVLRGAGGTACGHLAVRGWWRCTAAPALLWYGAVPARPGRPAARHRAARRDRRRARHLRAGAAQDPDARPILAARACPRDDADRRLDRGACSSRCSASARNSPPAPASSPASSPIFATIVVLVVVLHPVRAATIGFAAALVAMITMQSGFGMASGVAFAFLVCLSVATYRLARLDRSTAGSRGAAEAQGRDGRPARPGIRRPHHRLVLADRTAMAG